MPPDQDQAWDLTHRLRVRYCECEPMGVVHHSRYFPWLEEARTELLRAAGRSYAAMEASGSLLVIVALEATYRASARYDDMVGVSVRRVLPPRAPASRVKLRHDYEVRVLEGPRAGTVCMLASTTLACVDREGRVRPLPAELLA